MFCVCVCVCMCLCLFSHVLYFYWLREKSRIFSLYLTIRHYLKLKETTLDFTLCRACFGRRPHGDDIHLQVFKIWAIFPPSIFLIYSHAYVSFSCKFSSQSYANYGPKKFHTEWLFTHYIIIIIIKIIFPLFRAFIHIFLRQNMSLRNTMLRLFCRYCLWRPYNSCFGSNVLLHQHFPKDVCGAQYGIFLYFINFMVSWYGAHVFSEWFLMVPVTPIITGITLVFTFHIRWISIVLLLLLLLLLHFIPVPFEIPNVCYAIQNRILVLSPVAYTLSPWNSYNCMIKRCLYMLSACNIWIKRFQCVFYQFQ
jgi:hypothetical protein